MPGDQLLIERLGDLVGQDGLAGARLALDQQRPFERDRGVDGDLQILRRDIGVGALEPLHVLFRCYLPALFVIASEAKQSRAVLREVAVSLRASR